MTKSIRAGLVGLGKIARDQHLPAIALTGGIDLVAVASRNAAADGVANFPDLAAMLAGQPDIDAVILCQPPQVRYDAARAALLAGKHVFLEKPPGATLSEVESLADLARRQGVTLFASWHSRYSVLVGQAKAWCANRTLTRVEINWKEDVRRWHPGQEWIWQAGGFGVFDPGINALSVLTEVLDAKVRLIDAALHVPSNRAAPIAAELTMASGEGTAITAAFDWRHTGQEMWQILFEAGTESYLFDQGSEAAHDVADHEATALNQEYPTMYRCFVDLVRSGQSEVDVVPLQLVADACMRGTYCTAEPFEDRE